LNFRKGIKTVAKNIPANNPVIERIKGVEYHRLNAFPKPSIIRGKNKIEIRKISLFDAGVLKNLFDKHIVIYDENIPK